MYEDKVNKYCFDSSFMLVMCDDNMNKLTRFVNFTAGMWFIRVICRLWIWGCEKKIILQLGYFLS